MNYIFFGFMLFLSVLLVGCSLNIKIGGFPFWIGKKK